MTIYALIDDSGAVVNRVRAEDPTIFVGFTAIALQEHPEIGWLYDAKAGTFAPPTAEQRAASEPVLGELVRGEVDQLLTVLARSGLDGARAEAMRAKLEKAIADADAADAEASTP